MKAGFFQLSWVVCGYVYAAVHRPFTSLKGGIIQDCQYPPRVLFRMVQTPTSLRPLWVISKIASRMSVRWPFGLNRIFPVSPCTFIWKKKSGTLVITEDVGGIIKRSLSCVNLNIPAYQIYHRVREVSVADICFRSLSIALPAHFHSSTGMYLIILVEPWASTVNRS